MVLRSPKYEKKHTWLHVKSKVYAKAYTCNQPLHVSLQNTPPTLHTHQTSKTCIQTHKIFTLQLCV